MMVISSLVIFHAISLLHWLVLHNLWCLDHT